MIVTPRQLLAGILSITLAAPAFSETHNAVGNRTQKVSTIPGFAGGLTNYNANDQLATDTYDNDGNTTASNGVGYVYDFENHVIQAGSGITMVYDGDGNRVKKTVAGVTTTYLVDTQNPTGYAQVVEENFSGTRTPNSENSRVYVYGLERISQLRSYQANNTTHTQTSYYLYDGHGSTRALTDTKWLVSGRVFPSSQGPVLVFNAEGILFYTTSQQDMRHFEEVLVAAFGISAAAAGALLVGQLANLVRSLPQVPSSPAAGSEIIDIGVKARTAILGTEAEAEEDTFLAAA